MQALNLLLAVVAFPVLNACSEPIQFTTSKLTLLSKNECELVFKSQSATLIENFCVSKQKPILIQLHNHEVVTNWIDEKTSRFLFQEGCAEAGQCYYEFSAVDSGLRGRFVYRINLTEGEYTFEVDSNGKSKLLTESSSDVAS